MKNTNPDAQWQKPVPEPGQSPGPEPLNRVLVLNVGLQTTIKTVPTSDSEMQLRQDEASSIASTPTRD